MLLRVDCLPNAVGKQPSIPLIYLGRKWTLKWWWWWWLVDFESQFLRVASSHTLFMALHPGLKKSAWIGTRLLVQTMCLSSWRSWLCTSQVSFSWTAHGAKYEQKDDWRQMVLTLWPCGMEQSSSASAEQRRHPIIRLFQKTLEEGPVQTDHPKINIIIQ